MNFEHWVNMADNKDKLSNTSLSRKFNVPQYGFLPVNGHLPVNARLIFLCWRSRRNASIYLQNGRSLVL